MNVAAPLPDLGTRSLAVRGTVGGVLMGLANLVPGISGGTMLLATGVYTHFIRAIAEVTTLRFRARPVSLLAVVGLCALLAIVLLAGPVKHLVTDYRWVMYSIFIGLTLGGVPLVLRLARPVGGAVAGGALVGFALMVVMAFTQAGGAGGGGFAVLLVAGIAGAGAMVLPGVSGAYMLLVLGQYETILGAIDQCKHALRGDTGQLAEALHVVVPVGIGVAVGVVGISNLLRWALERHAKPTLGILLGLLLGAVLGIWPFQHPVAHGEPRAYYAPAPLQVLAAVGLVLAGFLLTLLIDRLGRRRT